MGHRGAGTIICSVCAGAFILADAGLLQNRQATTHWGLALEFARKFPDIKLDINKILINDGDIITAAVRQGHRIETDAISSEITYSGGL